MTTQLPLTGMELKEQGIQSLEQHRWVDEARMAAEAFLCAHVDSDIFHACERNLFYVITTDDLHDVMEPPPHDNCYGAIFHDSRFRWTGERVRSKRPEAHGREIRVWRLA